MRAIHAETFGGPDVLRPVDVPDPVPDTGELLLDVTAAGVLFLDTQLRAGWGQEFFSLTPPYVPGVVVVGTVRELGEGVASTWAGEQVAASTSGPGAYRGGGYAERAVVPVSASHLVPERVDPVDALAAHDGVMAVSRLAKAGLRPGDSALVTAASGAIGTWLIPLLADAGVRVVAAAHGPGKTALATARGADLVLDYADEGWMAEAGGPVDVVFDGAGGDLGTAAFELVRPGGRFFSYGAAAGDFAAVGERAVARDVEVVGIDEDFTADDMARAMEEALRLLAERRLKPVIGLRLPLEEAAAAHRAIEERRVLGKTVLTP